MTGPPWFEVFRDEDGCYRWRLHCDGGAVAEGRHSFLTDWNADRAARAFRRAATEAEYSYRESGGEWFWECLSRQGQPVAVCAAPLRSSRAARAAAERVRRLAPAAIGP